MTSMKLVRTTVKYPTINEPCVVEISFGGLAKVRPGLVYTIASNCHVVRIGIPRVPGVARGRTCQ